MKHRNDILTFEHLEPRLLMDATTTGELFALLREQALAPGDCAPALATMPVDDCGDTPASAERVHLTRRGSGRARGKINYGQDVDVLAFVARQSGTLRVEMETPGRRNRLDCRLAARDAAGRLLALGSDSGRGADAVLTLEVVRGETYYLDLAGDGGATGRYRVEIVTGLPVAVQPEPPPPEPGPAKAVTAVVLAGADGLQLLVLGTDEPDVIAISQSPDAIVLTAGGAVRQVAGAFDSVVVHGFAGADVIRLTHTVTASSEVHAGDGDDRVFDAAGSAGTIYGGSGDDLLVSVGGGSDTLHGQDGLDSFWADASDCLADAGAGEHAAGSVHSIAEFYQPSSSDPSSPAHVSLEVAGQDLPDPSVTGCAAGYAGFADVPLFVDRPDYDDVAQGGIGDCYYLACLASIADADRGVIEQAIAPLGDGTFAVRFYRDGAEVYVRLDADLPVTVGGALSYARLGADGELWVPLLEKAYAYFRYGENSYGSIHGGWMTAVYRELTGMPTAFRWTIGAAEDLYGFLASSLTAGHAVTMGSYENAPAPVVGSHGYMVKSVETNDSGMFVTLYNPWGTDGRAWDDSPHDGLLTISIEQVQQSFTAAVMSAA